MLFRSSQKLKVHIFFFLLHMNRVSCIVCHQISSVTSNTQAIRCYYCSRAIYVGNNNNKESDLPCLNSCLDFRLRTSRRLVSRVFSIKELKPPKGKRALLCGVTYKDQKFKLKGTIQDVLNMKKLLLEKFSFSSEAILVLAGTLSLSCFLIHGSYYRKEGSH